MARSLSSVYRPVFSTEEWRPWLRDKTVRQSLQAQLGAIAKRLECPPLVVGGVEDHVHLLGRLGRSFSQAEWVQELERVSNL